MKPKALWNLLLVCLGILCMVQLLAQMLDWNHHKADSKDKSFRLSK